MSSWLVTSPYPIHLFRSSCSIIPVYTRKTHFHTVTSWQVDKYIVTQHSTQKMALLFVVCTSYVGLCYILVLFFFWPSLWLPEISQTLLMFTRPTSSFRNGVMSTTPCIGTAALLLTVVFSWCSGADGHRCGHQTADSAGRGLPSSQRCCCCPRTFPGRNN